MILIAGATGTLGEEIAIRLLQNGEDVRVLVRHHLPSEAHFWQSSADAVKTLIAAGAQPVYGDLKDLASLDAACLGVKQLLTTANSAARHGQDNSQSVDLPGNRNLIDAARQLIAHRLQLGFGFLVQLGGCPGQDANQLVSGSRTIHVGNTLAAHAKHLV